MIVDLILVVFFTVAALWMGWNVMSSGKITINTIAMAVFMTVTATGTYWSVQEFRGYPVDNPMPKNAVMLWADVQVPTENSKGRIFVWVLDPREEVTTIEKLLHVNFVKVPRAYEIPYTEQSAREAEKGMQNIAQGKGVVVGMESRIVIKDGKQEPQINLEVQALDPYKILRKNSEE
jgi:hypothetical protein